jgi:hypothetical protein
MFRQKSKTTTLKTFFMSQVKWVSIAEGKKKFHVLFFKNHPFDLLMNEAALFPFKITSLASCFLSAVCVA